MLVGLAIPMLQVRMWGYTNIIWDVSGDVAFVSALRLPKKYAPRTASAMNMTPHSMPATRPIFVLEERPPFPPSYDAGVVDGEGVVDGVGACDGTDVDGDDADTTPAMEEEALVKNSELIAAV
jgi:hypothetical protein